MHFRIITLTVLVFVLPNNVAGSYDQRCSAIENLYNINVDII